MILMAHWSKYTRDQLLVKKSHILPFSKSYNHHLSPNQPVDGY